MKKKCVRCEHDEQRKRRAAKSRAFSQPLSRIIQTVVWLTLIGLFQFDPSATTA